MDLDKLTDLQKASINYHTSELSLLKREYERKEVYEHEDSRNQSKIQKHTTETSNN